MIATDGHDMSPPTPQLTLVTPTFNQAATIAQTLQSVLDQRLGPALQYIIQDACSSDRTEQVVRPFEPAFREQGVDWLYVRERDQGQADAINRGWQRARGGVLGYINSDDFFMPGALRGVLTFFADHPGVHWAYGGWQLVGASGRVHRTILPRSYRRACLLNYSFIGQPSCFFRHHLFQALGGLNTNLHLAMDYDLWLRIAERHDAAVIPSVLSAMRYHADAKSAAFTRRQLREILDLGMRYTRPLGWRRLCQYFFYLRGLAVVIAGRDIARRISAADQAATAAQAVVRHD